MQANDIDYNFFLVLQMSELDERQFTGSAQDYLDWFKGVKFEKVSNILEGAGGHMANWKNGGLLIPANYMPKKKWPQLVF